jgi:hypothetical protein
MRFAQTITSMILLGITGCVTHIAPTVQTNPPPRRALMSYAQFELEPVQLPPEAHGGASAGKTIDEQMRLQVEPLLKSWNRGASGPVLRVQPIITDLKFVSGGERAIGGALAGSSAVVMRLRLVDEATGEVVAEPEFYQRANAMGSVWTSGWSDYDMLSRIATVAREYLSRNYAAAIGGPTGLERASR